MAQNVEALNQLLDISNPAHFEELMMTLLSTSNELRQQAEDLFNACKQHAVPCATQLIAVLKGSQKPEARTICAVLLRQALLKKDSATGGTMWTALPPDAQVAIKAQLLVCMQEEALEDITKKITDAVSSLAEYVWDAVPDTGGWPELLPTIFQWVQSDNERLCKSAFAIFSDLASGLAPTIVQHIGTLHNILALKMAAGTKVEVRIAALRATVMFILCLEEGKNTAQCNSLQDLVPAMWDTLSAALQAGEELAAQEIMNSMMDLAMEHPRFLRSQLPAVLNAMVSIAEAADLEENTRSYAVEFLLTLAEAREKAPGMFRKAPQFVQRLFQCLLTFLLDIEDEEEWHSSPHDEDEVSEGLYDIGQEGLDRLAISMGGKTIMPLATQMLQQLLQSQEWEKRHAALMALSQIAEGCAKVMMEDLESVTNLVVNYVSDPHPRVRWAAIHCIGQMCTDLGPKLQHSQHAKLMPALIAVMDDAANPRVQAHASSAVVNFSENCKPEIMQPYMDALISKLMTFLSAGAQEGRTVVTQAGLVALASVADCAQREFEKYYDAVMPFLKTILSQCMNLASEDRAVQQLRAKSMECISLVGMAVGKERFGADAKAVMELLTQMQSAGLKDDDPTVSYMLQAWARLCKCMGQDFLPYLSFVMPPLLKSVTRDKFHKVRDADDDDDDDDDEDDWETMEYDGKKISIKTSALEEKATACNMLYCYADELKEGFFPYVEQVTQIMLPLVNFQLHEEVRKAAITALPELLNDAKLAVDKGLAPGLDLTWVKAMLDTILDKLMKAVQDEPEVEVITDILVAIHECIDYAGALFEHDPPGKAAHLAAILGVLKEVMTSSGARTLERQQRRHTEDFDEEELEALEEENETETEVFDLVSECLSSYLKCFKTSFLPVVQELMPLVLPMLGADRTPEERRVALCVFDDIVEYAHEGGACLPYLQHFLPAAIQACRDEDANVRQAAVYGLGVCAQYTGEAFQQAVPAAMEGLLHIVRSPDNRDEDNVMATDNAISAIGKLCEFQRAAFDPSLVFPAWLEYLPVRDDKEEALAVHESLVRMVESRDKVLLGAADENLPAVVKVFAQLLGTDLVDDAVAQRIRVLVSSVPQGVIQGVFMALAPADQQRVQAAMQAPPASPPAA